MFNSYIRCARPAASSPPGVRNYGARTYTLGRALLDSLWVAQRPRTFWAIWGKGRIAPALREEIMLAVARVNQCRYCTYVHSEWALAAGVTDTELAALEGLDEREFDRSTWLAIAHARTRASAEFRAGEGYEFAEAVGAALGPEAVTDVEYVARVTTLTNRTMNTFDALIDRLRGAPREDTRIRDELALTLVGVPGFALMALMMAARRRKGPAYMWAGFRAIGRTTEAS